MATHEMILLCSSLQGVPLWLVLGLPPVQLSGKLGYPPPV